MFLNTDKYFYQLAFFCIFITEYLICCLNACIFSTKLTLFNMTSTTNYL